MKPKFNVAIFRVGELFVVNILGYFAYHVFCYQQHQIMFPHTLFIQIQVDFQNDFNRIPTAQFLSLTTFSDFLTHKNVLKIYK